MKKLVGFDNLILRIFVSLLLLLFATHSRGQDGKESKIDLSTFEIHRRGPSIDSLKQLILNGPDTTVVNSYLELSYIYGELNSDSAILLSEKVLDLIVSLSPHVDSIKQQTYNTARGNALGNIAFEYYIQNNFNRSMEYEFKAIKAHKISGNLIGQGNSYLGLGLIQQWQHDDEQAKIWYTNAWKIFETANDQDGVSNAIGNLAWVYMGVRDSKKALKLHKQSLAIRMTLHDTSGIANSLNSIGTIYQDMGEDLKDNKKLAKIKLDSALFYYKTAHKFHIEAGNDDLADSYLDIGSIHYALGDWSTALEYAFKSDQYAKYPSQRRDIERLKYQIYKDKAEYEKSFTAYELFIQLRDTLFNDKTQKDVIRQQTKYEFEKEQLIKEQEKKEASRKVTDAINRRNNLQYSVILIALLILFGGVLSLGFMKVSVRMAEGIIFFSFLIFFEFLLVLADPYIDRLSSGAPGIKLLFNALIAAMIFPLHAFFESKLKSRLSR